MIPRFAFVAVALVLALGHAPAGAEDFYKGRNLRMLVGFSPGGGYDTYTRYIGRHISQYIPGNPTPVVQNMPGAGEPDHRQLHLQTGQTRRRDPGGLGVPR